ncbi:MAG: hypothetical protein DBX90_08250 [Lentisphaerae bacterium]|nr:MAG: hypothetical protein DBX90_08250 [Lentisphaerota bacterium]
MNIDQFTEVISACRFCFMCRHLSATGMVSCRESDTPRVRALIADTVRKYPEKLADADFTDAVYRSDLAGANRFHCDGYHDGKGYDELGLQLALRRDIVDAGKEPEAVKKLADEFEATASWQVSGSGDVLYFLDRCTAETPAIAESFGRLATKKGVAFRTVTGGCIGKVLRVLGYTERSKAAAKKFAAFINNLGAKTLVVSNPAAYDALVHDFAEYGVALNVKVMHSSEFLTGLKLDFKRDGETVYELKSDFLKNYGRNALYAAELLGQLGVKNETFGHNDEESYTAGEGAVVLQQLHPELVNMLAARVAEKAEGLLVTASPYTRKVLAETGLNILTFEELADRKTR